jgi:hypothetical protein
MRVTSFAAIPVRKSLSAKGLWLRFRRGLRKLSDVAARKSARGWPAGQRPFEPDDSITAPGPLLSK